MSTYKEKEKALFVAESAFNKVKRGIIEEAEKNGSVPLTAEEAEQLFSLAEDYAQALVSFRIQEWK